jgi:hypothetical protein
MDLLLATVVTPIENAKVASVLPMIYVVRRIPTIAGNCACDENEPALTPSNVFVGYW